MSKKAVIKFNAGLSQKQFMQKVQEQFVEKYASDMVNILEDRRKLENALNKVNQVIKAIEGGDYSAIEKYKKARSLLEVEENAEL